MLDALYTGVSALTPDQPYVSFLLRMQWMDNNQQPTWLISMQKAGTGDLRWFPNLDTLIQFLLNEYGERRFKAPVEDNLPGALSSHAPAGISCFRGENGD
jgi:hypothetical protein